MKTTTVEHKPGPPNLPPTGKRPAPTPKPPASKLRVVCILEQATYKPGDQAPDGYLARHEWAEVQHKAGLRQKQCGRCG